MAGVGRPRPSTGRLLALARVAGRARSPPCCTAEGTARMRAPNGARAPLAGARAPMALAPRWRRNGAPPSLYMAEAARRHLACTAWADAPGCAVTRGCGATDVGSSSVRGWGAAPPRPAARPTRPQSRERHPAPDITPDKAGAHAHWLACPGAPQP
eukprot:CAMPEP_0176278788 /NCGR_PEP_ID=MMETSP0121_2-20121125/48959_1 /TAXON_ID=160619 /ORGANISM="Kryptoperidinium foliaceum, Strain CCMP 1326" /LENGTH=155 /DNA_ID=CAMNT_0017619101 /DNA_START=1 /DNA_END=466 /DNA_ORIENTATION=-